MSDNEKEEVRTEELSLEEVQTKLIALGINSCLSSYDQDCKDLARVFFEMPISKTSCTWPFLSERGRLNMIDSNIKIFEEWLDGLSG